MQPLFTRVPQSHVPAIMRHVERLCAKLNALPAGSTIDMDEASIALGLDALSSVAFGDFPMNALDGGEPGATLLRSVEPSACTQKNHKFLPARRSTS